MINKVVRGLVVIGILMNFVGCASNTPIVKTSNEPKWLNDPYINNDSIAAVGCARVHYDGVPGQKKLAVANAIDEIASQVNTTVANVTARTKRYDDGIKTAATQKSSSLHSVNKVSLQTKIKAYYTKIMEKYAHGLFKNNV